jgi:hypothetical protein
VEEPMNLVFFSLALFTAVFLVHWLLWRVWRPRRQILALLFLFFGLLPGVLLLFWGFPEWEFWPRNPWEWLHALLFYVAVSLAYIVVFSALEQDSPSLTVVVFVADAGQRGRTQDELYKLIDLDFIVGERFEAMLHGKMIEQVGDVYRLTPKGLFWARLFWLFRKMFKLELGG